MLGVPAQDVTAVVRGARRLEDAKASGAGLRRLQSTGIPLDFSLVFRQTGMNTATLGDFVLRTAYGGNYTSSGSGAFAGNALLSTMASTLRAQGLPVPAGLAQASLRGSAPVFVVVTTTVPPGPPEPEAADSTMLVAYAATGVGALLVLVVCGAWCWRKSRIVTGGQKDMCGMEAEFVITRPGSRHQSILGRTVSRLSREKTDEAKTVVRWEYNQEELLSRHKSFLAQSSRSKLSNSKSEVGINIDGPSAVAQKPSSDPSNDNRPEDDMGEGELEVAEEESCRKPYRGACNYTQQMMFAYPVGTTLEYFSRTHGKWASGVISRTRLGQTSDDLLFDVRVGRQLRSEVSLSCLRPVLLQGMPVFACTERRRLREDKPGLARRRRGPAVKEVWRPAVIHGPQKNHATRVGYRVRLEEEPPRDRGLIDMISFKQDKGRVVVLAPHRLRRRFPPGIHVDVYRGPGVGWMPAAVHACAADMVTAKESSRNRPAMEVGPEPSSPELSPTFSQEASPLSDAADGLDAGGSSEELGIDIHFDTMEFDPSAFSAEVSEKLRRELKDREEEGQLVPVCRHDDPEGEPEWLPGFLLRHRGSASVASAAI